MENPVMLHDNVPREARAPGRLGARVLGFGILALGLTAAAGPAAAVGKWPELPTLRDYAAGHIRGPAGWEAWCSANPDACLRAEARMIALDAATAALLERVFAAVHTRITAREEPPGQDVWRVVEGEGYGDCEDYALTWREELVAAGLPRGALDIAVAETEQGEIHAVLAVHTDLGTLVFDNRQKAPMPWASLPYAWLAIEPVSASLGPWQALPDHHRIGTTPPLTAEGEARR
jgi:predicted transglutaminase-like cysteine proteinase